ncbi:MAG: flagellar motor protein [Zetaproteobacteria bacterium CG_4_9_14_3_um_filter_54_145]|nr:MAG: flagellar motor protein [Zetaproteobacteria bacterium CG_4_10_14_3_um_filter_54_28]PJA27924.1 MAG: flagellar motor protein [Zetaproteobacteria bacterium CG_4_9_14_3_um_filter_54_145]
MYRFRLLCVALLLMLSSCSTIEAIFGPDEPVAPAENQQLASENQQLGTEVAALRESLKQVKQEIADSKAASSPQAEEDQAAPTDRLWVTVSFRSGYMELTRESRSALKRLAEKFLSKPRAQTIEVRGYTDNEPIGGYPGHRHTSRHPYQTNMALSHARATNVAQALIAAGIAKDVVRAVGFGASNYVADNTTDAGRQRNRRAEIHLVRN